MDNPIQGSDTMSDPIEVAQHLCSQCGKEVDVDARFCKHCAFDLLTPQPTQETGPNFELDQKASRNNLPLIVGGIVIVLLIGFVALFAFVKLSGSSATANSNSSQASTALTLSVKGQKAEERILRGEALSPSDLEGLSPDDLRIVRNVHFAKYGRKYERSGLGDYFFTRSWYKPSDDYSETKINASDKANIDLILRAEKGETTAIALPTRNPSDIDNAPDDIGEGEDIHGDEFPSANPDADEAVTQVKKFWEEHATKCGDSYYSAGSGYESGMIRQSKNVTFTLYQNNPVTEADRLNGILWKGSVAIRPDVYRDRSYNKQWQDWKQWPPRNPGETVTATKRTSGWQVLQLQSITRQSKVSCTEIAN